MKKIALILFLFSFLSLSAQEGVTKKPKKFYYSAYLSLGRSQFGISLAAPSKFPTVESRIGATITFPVNSTFSIHSRFLFGSKFKRDPFNKPGQGYLVGPPYLNLDEVSGSRNHYFLEIPLMIQYGIPNSNFSLSAGANYKFFFADNDRVDFLTFRGDAGVLFGVNYAISTQWKAGVEYLHGLTKVYRSIGSVDGGDVDLSVTNNSLSVFVLYNFKSIAKK